MQHPSRQHLAVSDAWALFTELYSEHRGYGHGRRILTTLEDHARTVGSTRLLLETGVRNEAAITLFTSAGYTPIPGYRPHRDQRINRAFTKSLSIPKDDDLMRLSPS